MKRILLLVLLSCITTLSALADIANGICGLNLTWVLSDDGTMTISGTGEMFNYASSSKVPWYLKSSKIKKANIEEGVTSISNYAFDGYTALSSVSIPNSITSIGERAFYGCTGLTSLTIGNSVTSIGSSSFEGCTGLTSVTIPNSVTVIGQYAFHGCRGLTSVTIPNSVTSIGWFAFHGCRGLTSIVVESGNTVYDSRDNCNAIIETSTNELIIGCKNTVIPNSVTSIGQHAFNGCSGLTSVTIPNSVTNIGLYAFNGCTSLSSITIPNSVTSIDDDAFEGCTSLPIVDNIRYADIYAIEAMDKTLSSYTLKEGTKFIGKSAFYNCTGLISITIPNTVTSIGDYAFEGCSGLTSVTISNSVTSIGGAAFKSCSGLTSVMIPNSVTSIAYETFLGCTGLTSVTIGNSVTSIGDDAFSSCKGLTSVTIPNSVTSIGGAAFKSCSALASVKIGNSVTTIGQSAFSGCSGLTSIYVSWSRPLSIDSKMFSSVDKNNCTLYVPKGTFSMYAVQENWKNFLKIVEYDPEVQDAYLTIELNGIQASKIKVTQGSPCEVCVPEGYTKVTFNGTDVTSQINDGKYVTPSITKSSTISIYLDGGSDDVNGDGNVDSQDVLHIYDYMKNH